MVVFSFVVVSFLPVLFVRLHCYSLWPKKNKYRIACVLCGQFLCRGLFLVVVVLCKR